MGKILAISLSATILCGFAFSDGFQPMTASSVYREEFPAASAFDGDPGTRWASGAENPQQWLQIDLEKRINIGALSILWEAACADEYEIQVSDDGAVWKTIHHETGGQGGREELNGLDGEGRWLRILCRKPNTFGIYSIWEVSFPEPDAAAALQAVRDHLKAARLEATRAIRQRLREELERAGVSDIVFAARPMHQDGHWYANIGYFAQDANAKTYAKGGGLYRFCVASGELSSLVEDPEGTVRDPAVHYDGTTILFSWRKGGTDWFHLYAMQSDGSSLKQLTFGDYDDIEPAWLPDGGIVFVSSRCRRWVNCWLTQVAVVHRCDGDGANIVPLSANLEHDNTPWPMPDGRVLYTRWEYVDRSQVDYHHLWTMNPDGTAQTVFFGNMVPGGVFIDAKAVPGTDDVVFIDSPGHGAQEHAGRVALVNIKQGPDRPAAVRPISAEGRRDPYPVAPDIFLAANGKEMLLLNSDGVEEVLYTLSGDNNLLLHEPRPLGVRERERTIPRRVDYTRETGRVILADAYAGRNMKGVARGEIKKLLVLESLPKPINYTGGMDPLTYGGSFTLERVLGTAPVEKDGSAYIELPANRALFFVALDEKDDSVKRMQSFCTVMPGETLSCLGCHETRTTAGKLPNEPRLAALGRAPSAIEPIKGIPDVFDFPRDIQPILDKHCVPCHDYSAHGGVSAGPRAGGVILSGDRGPMFSHSYVTLTVRRQFVDGRDQPVSNLPPRSIGSGASPLMSKIRGGHHDVHLSAREVNIIRFWIETGAPYPGTYAALGCGSIGGYYANAPMEHDTEWVESRAASEVVLRRCSGCHNGAQSLPRNLSDENELSFWRPDWNDPRLLRSRHLVFNLSRPEKSLVLLAPLAKEAGGYGLCQTPDGSGTRAAVFAGSSDADYAKLLAMCVAGKKRLDIIKRFDMPGFRPPMPYIREMKRFGVLPASFPAEGDLDVYATDRAYWNSFDQSVALKNPAYLPHP